MPRRAELLGSAGFAALALAAATIGARRDAPHDWEVRSARRLQALPDALDRPWQALMALGTEVGVVVIIGVIALTAGRRHAAIAGATAVFVWATTHLLKSIVDRPRPDALDLDGPIRMSARGVGYPSGHAALTLALALVVATTVMSNRRSVRAFVVVGVAALVGVGRVYAGVHWPLDVVGGWAIGVLATALVLAAAPPPTDEPVTPPPCAS